MITVKYIKATALKTDTAKHKHKVPHTAFSGVFVITPFIFDFPIFLYESIRFVYYVKNRKTFVLSSTQLCVLASMFVLSYTIPKWMSEKM